MKLSSLLAGVLVLLALPVHAEEVAGVGFKPVRRIEPRPPIVKPPVRIGRAAAGNVVRADELVIGVVINGAARAYPLNAISGPERELINDTLGGKDIALAWCSLCHNGFAFLRTVGKRTLTFAIEGSLWNSNMVMFDLETKTQWSQFLGRAMTGELRGSELERLPTVIMDWKSWKQIHPETTVLNLPRTSSDYLTAFQKAPDTFVLGACLQNIARAYPFDTMKQHGAINDTIGSLEVVATYDDSSTAACLFSRKTEGRVLTFEPVGPRRMLDQETKSVWDSMTGHCVSGQMIGKQLEALPAMVSLYRSWMAFHPGSEIIYLSP